MVGSALIGAWIAQIAFVTLLLLGWAYQEIGVRSTAVFLTLWVAGLLARPYVPLGDALFTPFVAVLDIVLVFRVFRGDVRIT